MLQGLIDKVFIFLINDVGTWYEPNFHSNFISILSFVTLKCNVNGNVPLMSKQIDDSESVGLCHLIFHLQVEPFSKLFLKHYPHIRTSTHFTLSKLMSRQRIPQRLKEVFSNYRLLCICDVSRKDDVKFRFSNVILVAKDLNCLNLQWG